MDNELEIEDIGLPTKLEEAEERQVFTPREDLYYDGPYMDYQDAE